MFGIELVEFIIFLRQLGLAVAGAAALWGVVFSLAKRKDYGRSIAKKLVLPTCGGVFLAGVAWGMLSFSIPTFAHEGIVIVPSVLDIYRGVLAAAPLYVSLVLLSCLAGLWHLYFRNHPQYHAYISVWMGVTLFLVVWIMSLNVWQGAFSKEQWFFIGHSVHSIMTLGTVLILDYLFIVSDRHDEIKRFLYPYFPTISKVIWVGLGIDFLSVALIFTDALALTPKFFFMQTVVGILIINGIMLSGPLTRALLASVREGGTPLSRGYTMWAHVAGAVSIGSWTTITFVDSFDHLSLSYGALVMSYVLYILLLVGVHRLYESARSTHAPPNGAASVAL